MARVVYSATCSLDGYIAGPDGDMQWLQPYLGPNPEIDRFSEEVGALLVGRRTFTGDDPNRGTDAEGAFGGTWHGPVFVLTSQPPPAGSDGVTYVTDVRDGVRRAADAVGDGVVNVLGAHTARSCLEAGLLGEVLMIVAPVLLGDGTPLFAVEGGQRVALEPIRSTSTGMVTNLWFRVPWP
ncbi:dihydrofolate reductase family protein [Nitriliruptor alkaliphilus]|uniref:dihydrofolate reductase family protein n=1 Tax=Nitriliruptor alkaliphilus TaxID=427918 RepID=UPI0006972656|nr:dihydrofolate reductase family protein [Nitriliruptor alkaliphilus]